MKVRKQNCLTSFIIHEKPLSLLGYHVGCFSPH